MQLLEVVRRCRYCGSDMTRNVSSESYRENPFCAGCLNDRMGIAKNELGPIRNERHGHYLVAVRVLETVS